MLLPVDRASIIVTEFITQVSENIIVITFRPSSTLNESSLKYISNKILNFSGLIINNIRFYYHLASSYSVWDTMFKHIR